MGRLTPAVLARLLERIADSRTASYLLVADGRSEKCFFFPVGAVRASSVGARRVRELDEMLRRHPSLDPQEIERVLERHRQGRGPSLEEYLVDRGLHRVIHECSLAIVRDELIDLIVWEDAQYEFREGNPPPKLFDPRLRAIKLSTGVKLLLQEVQQKIARWQSLAGRFGAVRRLRVQRGNELQLALHGLASGPAGEAAAPGGATAELPVARHLAQALLQAAGREGGCSFDEAVLVCRRLGLDAIEAAEALAALQDARLLAIGALTGSSARLQAELKGQLRQEIEEIERALDLMIDGLVARLRLAECYEELGERERAAEHYRHAGEELARRNRAEEALGVLRKVLAIKPLDFGVRERIVGLLQRLRRVPDAVKEGMELARQYARFRLFNRAGNVLRRLVGMVPRDLELRRRLIDLLVRAQQTREAVAEYEQLALLYEELQEDQAALACYQQMLALEPEHPGARARMQQAVRRSKAYLLPYAALAAGYVLLVLGTLLVLDRYRDVRAFRQARAEAFRLAQGRDFAGARRVLAAVALQHDVPRERLEAVRAEIEQLEAYDREDRAASLFREGRDHERRRDHGEARSRYARLCAEFAGSAWAERARERLDALERAEQEASRLAREVRLLELDGHLEQAFQKARELLARHPGTEAARRAEIPLEIRSLPPGALIRVDGRSVNARTPFVLRRHAATPFELTLTLDGFDPWRGAVDLGAPGLSYPLLAQLQRRARWRAPTLGPLLAPPWVDRDVVVVGGGDQRARAFDTQGRELWARPLGYSGSVWLRPVRLGGMLVLASAGGELVGLEVLSGRVRWSAAVGGQGRARTGGLELLDERAVVLAHGDEVYAVEVASGERRWTASLGAPAVGAPVVIGEQQLLVVASAGGRLHRLENQTGAARPPIELGAPPAAPPCRLFQAVVVATQDRRCRLIRTTDGAVVWEVELPAVPTQPLVASTDAVYVALGAELRALSLGDGATLWSRTLPAPISAPPGTGPGAVFVPSADGSLLALAASSGEVRWSYRTAGRFAAAPVFQDDTVYAVSTDFLVHAVVN
ncbi:MAG: hypothetical protein KatS3mg102_1876 [Planctomycetota bacterium]|nr:MAG: hypothetical protein KatS3mg102_1876 [Planctomycetota bacterium]